MLTDRRMIFLLGRIHFLVLSSLLIAFALLETSSTRVLAGTGKTKEIFPGPMYKIIFQLRRSRPLHNLG